MILQKGMYAGIPIDQYIRDPAPEPSMSTGIAKALLDECPAQAWHEHPRLNREHVSEDTTQTDIGKIVHSVLLEGDYSRIVTVEADDWRTKLAKEQRDIARAQGKTAVLVHKMAAIEIMVASAKLSFDRIAQKIGFSLDDMLTEQTIIWQEDGVWCRTRPDLLTPDFSYAIDLKATEVSVNPNSFSRQITNMGYDIQASLFRSGVYAVSGKTPDVIFWPVSVSAPHLSSFVGLDPAFSEMGDRKLAVARSRFRACMESGEWPGYPPDICWVSPPAWDLARVESMELT